MTQTPENPDYYEVQFAHEAASPTAPEYGIHSTMPEPKAEVISATPMLPMHMSARPDRRLARQADYQVQDMIHRADITDVTLQSAAALIHRANQAMVVAPGGEGEYRRIIAAFVDGASRRIRNW